MYCIIKMWVDRSTSISRDNPAIVVECASLCFTRTKIGNLFLKPTLPTYEFGLHINKKSFTMNSHECRYTLRKPH